MASSSNDAVQAVRTHTMVVVAQLTLVALCVVTSQLLSTARAGLVLTMLLAGINGLLVAVFSLGLRRTWRPVYVVAAVLVIVCASALFWPAWGHYDGVRFR